MAALCVLSFSTSSVPSIGITTERLPESPPMSRKRSRLSSSVSAIGYLIEDLLELNYMRKACHGIVFTWSRPNVCAFQHLNSLQLLTCLVEVESFIDSREISPSTGSAQSLATAIRMLGDCMRQHPSCAACSTTFNPTRLIDLGLGEIPQPRLYEVLADCGKLAYMTLSHCWGVMCIIL